MKPERITRIRQVISGKANDLPAKLVRSGLRTLEPVYRTIAGIRNRSFDQRDDRVHFVEVPLISVGNLTTGGTGKTPLVRWVVKQLLATQQRPAIVSRGYGSNEGQPNDEFRELQLFLPETPHIQNPDRVVAAKLAIEKHHANCIVLDDGFQHRRIGRNLDVVLIDATCPFGFDHLLPRGLLREPVGSLSRADAVIITRVDQVSKTELANIHERIERHVDASRIAHARFRSAGWIDANSKTRMPETDSKVIGFCGIGNPEAFRGTLGNQTDDGSLQLIDFRAFPDHHDYTQSDLNDLLMLAKETNASALVCTVKDLVKIRHLEAGSLNVLARTIETEFESDPVMLTDLLQQTIRQGKSELE